MDLHGLIEVLGAMEEVFVLLAFYFSFHTIHVVIIHFNESVVPVTKGVNNDYTLHPGMYNIALE